MFCFWFYLIFWTEKKVVCRDVSFLSAEFIIFRFYFAWNLQVPLTYASQVTVFGWWVRGLRRQSPCVSNTVCSSRCGCQVIFCWVTTITCINRVYILIIFGMSHLPEVHSDSGRPVRGLFNTSACWLLTGIAHFTMPYHVAPTEFAWRSEVRAFSSVPSYFLFVVAAKINLL